ncbi:MAG: twin-arginine translocase TatA/TatE family subunit [Dehalococcoidia bacterium]
MDFFGISPLEIVVILIVGLIAFGPDKLPELARNLAKGMRTFRKATQDLTQELTREFTELEGEEKEEKEEKSLSRKEEPQVIGPTKKQPRKPRRTRGKASGSEQ